MSLEHVNFGEILHSLRVYKGMDIKELAKDICSEEDLVLFEKGKKSPTIDQLYKMAAKLNVQLSHFYDFTSSGSVNYVSAVFNLINKHKRDRNYKAIYEIVVREKENPLFNLPSSKQFLLWHEAICLYYLAEEGKRDKEKAIKKLYQAIDLTNPSRKGLTEREIEILVSIAIIEKDHSNYVKAITLLKEALDEMDKLPIIINPRVRLKALFGLSQALSESKQYEESLIYSNKGIKQCINDEVMYLFGEFYYQSGENYIKIGELDKGKEQLEKSIKIFELQNNYKFVDLVKNEMEKLLNL